MDANVDSTGGTPPSPTPQVIPPEPTPTPPVSEPVIPPLPTPAAPLPVPTTDAPTTTTPLSDATMNTVMNQVLETPSVVVAPEKVQHTGPPPPGTSKPKRMNPAVVVALFLLLLGAMGTGAYFVANPNNLADIRNQAANGDKWNIEKGCRGSGCVHDRRVNQALSEIRDDKEGNSTKGIEDLKQAYKDIYKEGGFKEMVDVSKNPQNLALPYVSGGYTKAELAQFYAGVNWNDPANKNRAGYPCPGGSCVQEADTDTAGYYLQGGKYYPVQVKTTKETDTNDNPPGTTPTPIAPSCIVLKIYGEGSVLTPSSLHPGQVVTLAVKGDGPPTKGHFRVNGKQLTTPDGDSDPNWTESGNKNANGEFTIEYTVPTGVTDFVIEAEIFADGAWR